jgi:AraC family transcriptional regulator
MSLSSSLHFVRARSGEPAPEALGSSTIIASSRGLGWDGLIAERGTVLDWTADDLTLIGHFIAINLDSAPLEIENKGPQGFRRVVMPPGSMWINPAGQSFTRRNFGVTHFGAIEVSGDKVRRALGRDVPIRSEFPVTDDALAALVRALLIEAGSGSTCEPLFVESIGVAIAARLSCRFGTDREPGPTASAPVARLKRAIEKIEDAIGDAHRIDELAALVGISPAYFAREFKRMTGETPHGFIIRRRLERARTMLAAGTAAAAVATECGFSDQAHLSRMFKQHFGVTPGSYRAHARQQRHGRS